MPENPEMYEMGVIASNMLHGHGYSMHWLTYVPEEPIRRAMVQTHAPPPYQTAWQPPLQTYIVYGAFLIWGETPRAALLLMLLNVVWSTILVLPVFYTTLLLAQALRRGHLLSSLSMQGGASVKDRYPEEYPEYAARTAAILTAVFLPAAYAVVTYTGSSLYHLVCALFFWMLLRAVVLERINNLLAAGACAGVQMLLRSEFLFLGEVMLVIAGGALVWQRIRHSAEQNKGQNEEHNREQITVRQKAVAAKPAAALAATITGCVLAVLIITPWMMRNYSVFGRIVPIVSRPWFEVWRGNNPVATGADWMANGTIRASVLADTVFRHITRELDALPYDSTFELRANAILKREALAHMQEHPTQTLALAARKVLFLWGYDWYNPQSRNLLYTAQMFLISILIWCGAWSLWRMRRYSVAVQSATALYGFFIVFYTGIFALTFVLPRYRIYVFSALLPLAALGAVEVCSGFLLHASRTAESNANESCT